MNERQNAEIILHTRVSEQFSRYIASAEKSAKQYIGKAKDIGLAREILETLRKVRKIRVETTYEPVVYYR